MMLLCFSIAQVFWRGASLSLPRIPPLPLPSHSSSLTPSRTATGPLYETVFSALGAGLFAFYIVYDTQLIMGQAGGKAREDAISPEEYVYAAVTLYLDIINLFM